MKYVSLVLFTAIIISSGTTFAQTKSLTSASSKDGNTYSYVEQMPAFPGGVEAMMTYLRDNIKYPEDAIADNMQGRVMLKFVVDETGAIRDAIVLRSVYPSLDSEALRVLNNMPKWKPGKQEGKNVAVYFTLPVSFKLEDNTTDTIPQFNGNLRLYIQESMNYPPDAKKNHIQGMVKIKVLVDENGKLHDPKIIKSVAPSLDAEALRIVKGMPPWKPALDNEKPIKKHTIIPIYFGIQNTK